MTIKILDAATQSCFNEITVMPTNPCSDIQGNLPDLQLSNFQNLPTVIDPTQVTSFNFDLTNAGDIAVPGDYRIGFYISKDQTLGNDPSDALVGNIITGNTAIGTISNIVAAIDIADGISGDWYLIGKADDLTVITESNENNNTLSTPITIDSEPGDGPKPTLSTAITTVDGPFTVNVNFDEDVTDLTLAEIQVTNGTKSNPAQQSGSSYSFTVTPSTSGQVTIVIPQAQLLTVIVIQV